MSKIISILTSPFRLHKLKMLGILAFAILFALLVFPYDDLADLATAKVSQITQNQVYLQFDSLDLGLLPPDVAMGGVSVETQTLPSIKASQITVAPKILSLITGKPGAEVSASGLFGGAIIADYKEGEKAKGGERMKIIGVSAKGIKLPELAKFLAEGNLSQLALQGTLSELNTDLNVDPLFDAQPTGEIGFKIDGFTLPNQTMRIVMAPGAAPAPLALPEVKMGNTKMKAQMGEGQLKIEDLSFGNDTTVAGKVSGTVGLSFKRSNAGVQPIVSAYDLKINLRMPKAFVAANEKAGLSLLFGFIPPAARKDTAKGTELAFRLQPPAPGSAFPQFTSLQ